MGKYNIYAIAYGIDPVTKQVVTDVKFSTWREALPYVNAVEGANYKGFLSDSEADLWLKKQCGMPRAARPVKSSAPVDPEYKPPIQSKLFKKSTLQKKQDDIKARFATKCVTLGLDPNSVIYYLMAQWNDMVSFFNICPDTPPPQEDDEDEDTPWF